MIEMKFDILYFIINNEPRSYYRKLHVFNSGNQWKM